MSDNQKIDPALLSDESPVGLNPDDAVNGGLELKNKPRGIKKINKKGLIAGAALIGAAAIVATTTFNQAGSGAADAAKSAVANQGKTNGRPGELKRDALWYANQPDKVAAADKAAPGEDQAGVPPRFGQPGAAAPAEAGASAPEGAAGQGVPDLTGKAISPLAAATAPKTGAPALGGKPGQAGAAGAAGARRPPLPGGTACTGESRVPLPDGNPPGQPVLRLRSHCVPDQRNAHGGRGSVLLAAG